MAVPLCCETQRETFSEVTAGFNVKFNAPPEPVQLDLTGSNYRFGRCVLPPPYKWKRCIRMSNRGGL